MIAHLSGVLREKLAESAVIDVGGVGYHVQVSAQTHAELPREGATLQLYVHTHVREDAFQLFGFAERSERDLFLLLKEVSGIGPRLALTILSGIPTNELRRALAEGDQARLVAISGVGRKTAERLVLELREKVGPIDDRELRIEGTPPATVEALSALVNLGYRKPDADRAVEAARASGKSSFEEIVREALKSLSR
ncbi:MAG: holliday junction helicase RuvA [Candidatus Binatota bacterium]|jgi:Holliday junction DNA helicase RuvA|nr:holliday junction helicase RuvA [Candidatus Binatota bacterium]